MNRFRLLCWATLVWAMSAAAAEAVRVPVIPSDADTATRVSYTPVFAERIVWVGTTPPPEAESQTVLHLLEDLRHGDPLRPDWQPLETFIAEHPQSPWTPSLRASLSGWYRDHGRYTRALAHWEAAWMATKDYQEGNGKAVANYAFIHWTRLLASLGRIPALTRLIRETQGRTWDAGPLQRIWEGTLEGYSVMLAQPGVSYRCGTYALTEVARQLKGRTFPAEQLLSLPSPTNGFSLDYLADKARTLDLDLVPVRRMAGDDIPCPAVVHWRQNHYAAIVEQREGYYRVVDPTFGHELWLERETINEEASGVFLAAAKTVGRSWQRLDPEATTKVFGQGFPNNIDDPNDEPCSRGQDGPEGSQSCAGCGEGMANFQGEGMPTWRVSEPYVTLWLTDEPLAYQPALGERLSFRLHYKQRDTRTNAYVYGVGPQWSFDWQTYVHPLSGSQAKLYVGGGGERVYTFNQSEFKTDSTMTSGSGDYTVNYADGSRDLFQDGFGILGDRILTDRRTRYGQSTHFFYDFTLAARLLEVWDSDGHTNSLSYTNATFPLLITSISDPFGRTAKLIYNGSGQLTNITDTAGNATTISYDTNGVVSSIVTPYGTTSFQITTAPPNYDPGTGQTNTLGGTNLINRSILVTEPTGAKQLYLYRDQSTELSATDHTTFLPNAFTLPDTGVYSNQFEDQFMYYRNSFHWNRQQYAALSSGGKADLKTLSLADYRLSRRKHWLHQDSGKVGGVLSMVQEPSPDGSTDGQRIWFDYAGKSASFYQGTNSDPLFVAYILPDGTSAFTRYERNSKSYPTNTVSTYSVGSTRYLRTNMVTYASNGRNPVTLQIKATNATDFLGGKLFYNLYDRLRQVTNALGEVTDSLYAYEDVPYYAAPAPVGTLTNLFLPSGLSVSNLFYSSGLYVNWLQQSIRPEIGVTNSFTYTNGLVYTFTDERGLTVTNQWDNFRRLVSRAYPDGTTVSNVFDRLHLAGTKDRQGNWTRFGYNALRQLTAVTNALTNLTAFGYCDCGALASVTNGSGSVNLVTSYQHDYAGRLTQVTRNDGSWVTYGYDSLGRRTTVNDSAGYSLTNWFNNQSLLAAASNQFGQVLALTYDHRDRATNIVNAAGVAVVQKFDGLDRVTKRTFADGSWEGFGFATNGLVSLTNRLGLVSSFTNDAAGRRIYESLAGQYVARFDYSAAGDLTRLRVGSTRTNAWSYDAYGRPTSRVDSSGNTNFIYTYSPNGWVTNAWTPEKSAITYRYDAVGNLTNIDYPSSTDVVFQYDPLNRLSGMTDATGTTAFAYGASGRLQTEDGPWANDTLTYGYNGAHRAALALGQPQAPDWLQTYGYDSGGRLQSVTDPNGAYNYAYSGASPLVARLRFPNLGYVTNTYDATLARLSGTSLVGPAGSVLSSQSYLYDVSGRLTNTTRFDASKINYGYDGLGQLVSAQAKESGGTARLNEQFGYSYDEALNLLTRTNNQLTLAVTADKRDRLQSIARSGTLTVAGAVSSPATSVTVNGTAATRYGDNTFALSGLTLTNGSNGYTAIGQDSLGRKDTNAVTVNLPSSAGYAYDQNGNLTSDGQLGYAYDDANRLATLTSTNAWQTQFVYDGLGRKRIRREYTWQGGAWVQTSETRYVDDGLLPVQERDGSNAVTAVYTRGRDLGGSLRGAGGVGGLLARSVPGAYGPTPAYYHHDGQGNVSALMAAPGGLGARYAYDPYGNTLYAVGPLAAANPYRFSGKEWHAASGLYDYGFRQYQPNLQRWLNQDPIQELGGFNLYGFVGNSPPNYVDSYGMLYGGAAVVGKGLAEAAVAEETATAGAGLAGPIGAVAVAGLFVGNELGHTFLGDMLGDFLSPLFNQYSDADESGAPLPLLKGRILDDGQRVDNDGKIRDKNGDLIPDQLNPFNPKNRCKADDTKPEDKFSRMPKSLMDQMALDAAKQGKGQKIMNNLGDPQFEGMEKWSYTEESVRACLRSHEC
jgi:RHS repeat-associated protein